MMPQISILGILTKVLIGLVALEHVWFLVLEMFLWKHPIGRKTFKNTPEKAEITAVLAANQGLYNGFLAAGLVIAMFHPDSVVAAQFTGFFLTCVVVAGVYGAWTVSKRILFVQALPAALALVAFLLSME